LVGQFEFVEWTVDAHLRHSRFVGLREDKEAKDVVRE
jgi:bifunctional non-homologous end joining protein LigD